MSPIFRASRNIQNQIWHNRNFALLWLATVVSFLAGSIIKLVLPVFAAGMTRSPVLVAGVKFAFAVPWLVFGLQAGALVDRGDRRHILLVGTILSGSALALLGLTTALGTAVLILLYAAAFIVGVSETLTGTATTALIPMLVRRSDLDGANARLIGAQQVVEIVASPVGGALVIVGLTAIAGVGSMGYCLALVPILFLQGSFRPTRTSSRRLTVEVIAGVRFLWDHRVLRTIGGMAAVINACWSAWLSVLVLYAVAPGPMHLTPFEYGLLFTGSGVGGVLSTALVLPIQRLLGRRWPIGINILGNAVMLAAPGLTANAWLVGGAVIVGGMVGPMWTVAAVSLQHRTVPAAFQGRVSAAYQFLGLGAEAVGPLLGGTVAQIFGVQVVFLGAGVVTLVMILPFSLIVTDEAMEGADHNPDASSS